MSTRDAMTSPALVIGGAGFIGSQLVRTLAARGHRVVVADALLHGSYRLDDLLARDACVLECGDICAPSFFERVMRRGPFGAVFHLAALHYIPACEDNPAEALRVNVVGTQALLSALQSAPPRSFIFASTGDVYGPKGTPHGESDALAPFSVYGLSKLFGERLIEMTSRAMTATRFTIARLFNTYGPAETNPHVIPKIMAQAMAGNRLQLGSVCPKRDFIHVSDVADALAALAARDSAAAIDVFNVGSGDAVSIEDLVRLVAEVLGQPLVIDTDPALVRPVERAHLQANNEKLRRATGWSPRVPLREGLRRLIVEERTAGVANALFASTCLTRPER